MMLALGLTASFSLSAQEFSLSSNIMDYANFGTLNAEASYGVSRHWSLSAGVKYNPFSFGNGSSEKHNRQRSCSAGARFWPWYVYSGWWLSGSLRWQEYNNGGFRSSETAEGDRVGSAFAGGYSYMIAPHFNLDFGLGMWLGYDRYVTYNCPTCGNILDKGEKFFILPGDIIVSLSYIF